jgi:hypothetical protein
LSKKAAQYRAQLKEDDASLLVHLSEKVVNAVSLELVHFQVPYTFYNIEARQGNNHFIITTMSGETPTNHVVTLPDGHYASLDTIRTQLTIQLAKVTAADARLTFTHSINDLTGKFTLNNMGTVECVVSFLTSQSKINILPYLASNMT